MEMEISKIKNIEAVELLHQLFDASDEEEFLKYVFVKVGLTHLLPRAM